jgi:hypothetical protein
MRLLLLLLLLLLMLLLLLLLLLLHHLPHLSPHQRCSRVSPAPRAPPPWGLSRPRLSATALAEASVCRVAAQYMSRPLQGSCASPLASRCTPSSFAGDSPFSTTDSSSWPSNLSVPQL